ncbi:hypothetical protein B0H16DRAFT_1717060 [Mycena metata]|uniref:NAD(P)-binding protein n=1 Tax=Mycena metata TaxID=1033252 RepID=A0AAD7NLX6_9AGAR|nr:hypothetical protein B0H16DRAFT_1717060 [Mycena metata]
MDTSTQPTTRVALVTGAAQGIGRAIALRLAADGLDVAVDDLDDNVDSLKAVAQEIERLGRKAVVLTSDVTKEKEVEEMVEATVSALGRLDVMIANAGVASGVNSVMDAKIEDWEKCWAVNIKGVLFSYKYAARQMVKQGSGGRIIGASSVCGVQGFAGVGAYCVSKAAVRSLTQTTALELREHGITVNAYAPGVIESNMTTTEADKEHGPGFGIKQLLKFRDEFRTGQPADVAAVASFLASPDAHFVTGQTISVNDGVYLS